MIDYALAVRTLGQRDPVLAGLIARVGPCRLTHLRPRDPFTALLDAMASQQLSVKAADTIFARLLDRFPDHVPTPERLLALDDLTLRAVGLSRPKITYVRDLAQRVVDGRLDLAGLSAMPDEKAISTLVEVKGIGRWTAEVFLMFTLERIDLFPVDDLGLVKAA